MDTEIEVRRWSGKIWVAAIIPAVVAASTISGCLGVLLVLESIHLDAGKIALSSVIGGALFGAASALLGACNFNITAYIVAVSGIAGGATGLGAVILGGMDATSAYVAALLGGILFCGVTVTLCVCLVLISFKEFI